MPHSLSKIIIHIVFSTKNRFPYLDSHIRKEMHAYLAGISHNLGCFVYKINGTADHVHIVCNLPRTISVSKLLEELKKSSSKWIKTRGLKYQKFGWQNGYGVFSVGESQLPKLIAYVERQEEHHSKKSFQDEYKNFLKRYKVEYDERYLWN